MLEGILICLGSTVVIISFWLGHRAEQKMGKLTLEVSEEQKKKWLIEIEENIKIQKNKIIETAEEEMCRISNEKIMAVNEYSEQVIKEIEKSHSEVVFLYQMLNNKEEEIKELILKKEEFQSVEEVETINQGNNDEENYVQEIKKEVEQLEHSQESLENEMENGQEKTQDDLKKKILSRYKKGKSVQDIAKELKMGQGEVQLIINLEGEQ